MSDLISRQAAIDAIFSEPLYESGMKKRDADAVVPAIYEKIKSLPSAQPDRLTDDDFETIRIHLNAFKENLCNQRRWKEAEEYQRIIDRFMAFASAQPRKGKWIEHDDDWANVYYECSVCKEPFVLIDGTPAENLYNFCPNCGCRMEEGE